MIKYTKIPNAVRAVIRAASRGQDCSLRVPAVCHCDAFCTVGAHLQLFNLAGLGQNLMICSSSMLAIAAIRFWTDAALRMTSRQRMS